MIQNPQLKEHEGNETFTFNNNGFDISNATNIIQMEQSSLNVLYDDINAADNYTNDLFMSDNDYATTSMTSFATDGQIDSTYSTPFNETQCNFDATIGQVSPSQSVMNSSLPINLADMTINPQTNDSEIFRFMIPGFQTVIIPTSSPLTNLSDVDMQYQFQQDHTFLDPSLYNPSVSSPQLNQEQNYISSVNGTTTGESSININRN
ncbi:hypothetical protein C1645_749666 [Glomus cerebriforme]|uniref:Uncharacterized protein n=1 Tax=Glomus cerebriforme TaxID=658196 RepID=A0A397TQ31_9GLOM|nr:hypothetical protein C1645_749666 [Glomus cerebriforme]